MYYVGKCCVVTCGSGLDSCMKGFGNCCARTQTCCLEAEKMFSEGALKSCKCIGEMAGNFARMCGENCEYCSKMGCETCACCVYYASGPWTICNLFLCLLYLIPGILWVVFAIMSWAGAGDECSIKHVSETFSLI